jgi:endogenous inhibitor of DNA gyrase (YacG/DUF329 family)
MDDGAEMKCPICGKPTTWNDNVDRPFCSERCRLIDLGNWSSEEYHISEPVTEVKDSPDEGTE